MLITITGKPCSGKSTIGKILEEKYGYRRIGVGDMFKAEAKKRGMSAEEFNAYCLTDPAYDYFIDNETARLGGELSGQKVIFDSRLAWHFVPHSFKVFVEVSDDEMARRLATSDRTGKEKIEDVQQARAHLINRFNLENQRYQKIYGIDNLTHSNYDFVVDSTNKTAEEIADEIYKKCEEYYKKQQRCNKKLKPNK